MIELTIDIDKIPKERIWTSKNGARKLFATLSERKEPSQYGETHSLYLYDSDTKTKLYIGAGKVKEFNRAAKPQEQRPTDDGFPF